MSEIESIRLQLSTVHSSSTEVFWELKRKSLFPLGFTLHSPPFCFREEVWKLEFACPEDLYSGEYPYKKKFTIGLMRTGVSAMDLNRLVRCYFGVKYSDGAEQIIDIKEFITMDECKDWQTQTTSNPIAESFIGKACLPDGHLTFFCRLSARGALTSTEASTQTEGGSPVVVTLIRNLKDLYVNGKNSDVTIKVKDETFAVHRAILGVRTPVLEAMFSHDMVAKESGVLNVDDCDPKPFAVFLLFVYTGETDKLTAKNVTSVYYIADKYDLPDLKEECIHCMLSTMAIDTICNVIAITMNHSDKKLLERATKFFQENAEEIFNTSQWTRFKAENATMAKTLTAFYYKYANTK